MKLNPTMLCDFYKVGHKDQYPENTTKIYSTWTCRGSRIDCINSTVFFGLQGFIKEYLIEYFNENFFDKSLSDVLEENKRAIEGGLGIINPNLSHIKDLWKLRYLPLEICAVPEGTSVPIRVPSFTMTNTIDEFFWLVNGLETLISAETWSPITTATIAGEYYKILNKFAIETTGSIDGVEFQAHDFSMRGMNGLNHASKAGSGHLLFFKGTDCIPAMFYLENYYNGNIDNCGIGGSIPATEHSVQCANMPMDEDETATIKRMITEVYPTGYISMVLDTNDFWKNITEVLPTLKDIIMKRDGKFVVRPDSGDPVDIICGNPNASTTTERKGLIEVLYEIFGGVSNDIGYKVLDEHIGAIYGDSITLDRAREICQKLKDKGFASTNVVLGVGSYSYAYHTRDTFGQAFKSTYAKFKFNGSHGLGYKEKLLSKNPKTDDGTKKSQKGLVAVTKEIHNLVFIDGLYESEKEQLSDLDLLKPVFRNGKLLVDQSIEEIRRRVKQ